MSRSKKAIENPSTNTVDEVKDQPCKTSVSQNMNGTKKNGLIYYFMGGCLVALVIGGVCFFYKTVFCLQPDHNLTYSSKTFDIV